MIRFILVVAPTLAALAAVPPGFAHAFLQRAMPPVGATVKVGPPVLALYFTEGVVPQFSRVQLLDRPGTSVNVGEPKRASDNHREPIVGLPKLPPGSYDVICHLTAQDTHKTEGRFRFRVAP
jgi:copper resistance protein C